MNMRQLAKKLVPIVFYVAFAIFLVLYLRSIDFHSIQNIRINWWYVLLSTAFGVAFRYWGAFIWFVLLKGLGATQLNNRAELIYVYAKSWLGRYIPGTAPWILGKIYFASKHGISKNKLAVSSLLEGGLQVGIVMIIAFLLLISDRRLDVINADLKLGMLLVVIIGAVCLIPAVFNRFVSIAYKIVKRKTLDREHLATNKTILYGVTLYAIGAIINGLDFFYIAKSVFPVHYSDAFFIIGAASLAGAVSMLAVFAPSGLGVREGIQLTLLSIIMPKELALAITVFTRIWGVVTDMLFFGIASLVKRLRSKK